MMKKRLYAWFTLSVFCLSGCFGKNGSENTFRLILSDMSAHEKQIFFEQEWDTAKGNAEILEMDENAAADMLRKGEADCGYGRVSGQNAIHYGILKSDVIGRTEMLLVSEKPILTSDELSSLIVGFPDDLDSEFIDYLSMIPDIEMHSYVSGEQLIKDLKAGLLDLAAADADTAFQIFETNPDIWQISQPADMPVLEYRFFACTQEALDQAEAFRKETAK